jgi:hypothetical protein
LKRDNSPPYAINTVRRGVAGLAGLAGNDHPLPLPLHYLIDDDLQPHLSHSYLSSPNVSSLCDFPAEYKRLEYVGISASLIASPCPGDRLITPKRMAPP